MARHKEIASNRQQLLNALSNLELSRTELKTAFPHMSDGVLDTELKRGMQAGTIMSVYSPDNQPSTAHQGQFGARRYRATGESDD